MPNKKELLKPKIDVVFHSIFRVGNEDITKAIITAITKEKIKKIDISKDRHLFQKYPNKKLGIIDLKAILNDGISSAILKFNSLIPKILQKDF